MTIRLASTLQPDSIVDGEGIRTVVWTQGNLFISLKISSNSTTYPPLKSWVCGLWQKGQWWGHTVGLCPSNTPKEK